MNEDITILVYYFLWLFIFPALLIGAVITVLSPSTRPTAESIIRQGIAMYMVLLVVYMVVGYVRNRKRGG